MKFDVIVIGGGAAGLFCAIEAGKRGRRTLVIEHNTQVGRKIVISGGGRCNFTNIDTGPENFLSANPHFCKSALARYRPQDFVELVKKHRISFYEKKLGQLFCRETSRAIVTMLLDECAATHVKVMTGTRVQRVEKGEAFRLETEVGSLESESLVIATGGLSFPKVGASGFGYRIATQFGLKIVETRPSLVPLKFYKQMDLSALAGVSIDSIVATNGASFRENILFTHRGLSGPAILQISNYWNPEEPISIDLLPEHDSTALVETNRTSTQTTANFLARVLPKKFSELFPPPTIVNKRMNELTRSELDQMAKILKQWRFHFADTEGYDKAEVTIGGVSTDELSSQTMETRSVPGLYFIGEVVDVTGWLGGYNFQWAWSSGFAAGRAV
ncbi:MAG TPA: NAD(P)/FAD-dependent oxidoreductase [Pyrinomonadaceae bacterium]|nr:NAD(P)/FAD-dependent oxidoreductase [Pyrinomonadaceae bacterium]